MYAPHCMSTVMDTEVASILAILDDVAVNIWIHISFQFCVFPEVELLGSSLPLVIAFVLQFILSDISIATPALKKNFHLHKISFSIPLLSVSVCLLI